MSLSHDFFGCPRRHGGQRADIVSRRRRGDGCPPSEGVRRACLLGPKPVETPEGKSSRAAWIIPVIGAVVGLALGAGVAWRTAIAPISAAADVLGTAVETIDSGDRDAVAGPRNRFYDAQSRYAGDSARAARVPGSVSTETLARKRGEALRRLRAVETRGGL